MGPMGPGGMGPGQSGSPTGLLLFLIPPMGPMGPGGMIFKGDHIKRYL